MSEDRDRFYSTIMQSLHHRRELDKKEDKALKLNIAASLVAYRDEHRLSQDDLAMRLKVSRRQVMRWEKGQSKPSNLAMEQMRGLGIIR